MSYQIARACAVANYVELYFEMDLLPDVSVAEEARASGSMKIYDAIMQSPIRYRIMNDYNREVVPQGQSPAFLNNDTAIVSTLDVKQGIKMPRVPEENPVIGCEPSDEEIDFFDHDGLDDNFYNLFPFPGFEENMFNITEDLNMGEVGSELPEVNYLPELLSQPLPLDLPPGNKDVLILMAAYYGNIERYAKLRPPRLIERESGCLVRGIYHNSMFALWCANQIIPDEATSYYVKMAVHARMIMNNDLSHIINLKTSKPYKDVLNSPPYLIWYPNPAKDSTYKTLAATVPYMRPSVLHASVYLARKSLFDWLLDSLGVSPTPYAWKEALVQSSEGVDNPSYFMRRLKARSEELGVDLDAPGGIFKMASAQPSITSNYLAKELTPESIVSGLDDWGYYNKYKVDASEVELFAFAPESWRPDWWKFEIDYEDWPEIENAEE